MPNKKKKQQITGFTVFMKEIMPQLKKNGVLPANAGLAQCVPLAHPRWKVGVENGYLDLDIDIFFGGSISKTENSKQSKIRHSNFLVYRNSIIHIIVPLWPLL